MCKFPVIVLGMLQMLILGAFFFPFQNAFVFFNLCTYLFMFGCVVLIAVHGFFSRCGKQGLLSSCGAQTSHFRASCVIEQRFQGKRASVVSAPGLQSTGLIVMARAQLLCGMGSSQIKDQACLLRWQADSLTVSHQEPCFIFSKEWFFFLYFRENQFSQQEYLILWINLKTALGDLYTLR